MVGGKPLARRAFSMRSAASVCRFSSAQLTAHYSAAELVGRQVLCVCNFAPKRVAGVRSEVLVTGVYDQDGKVVLASFDHPLPNGARLA